MKNLAILFVSTLTLLSCKIFELNSNSKGHFEKFSEEDLLPFKNKLVAIPQYEKYSDILIDVKAGEDVAASILNTNIDRVHFLFPPQFMEGKELADLQDARIWEIKDELNHTQSDIELSPNVKSKMRFIKRKNLSESTSRWIRDFAPITTKHVDSEKIYLVDFNYHVARIDDDALPQAIEEQFNMERISLPLYFEGGNFMINSSRTCMMTERALTVNQEIRLADLDKKYDESQVRNYFKDYLGCKTVHIFPKMPYETTEHIDIWAKFLDDNTILLSEVKANTLKMAKEKNYNYEKLIRVDKFLKARKQDFIDLGYKVVTVPQPLLEGRGPEPIVRSYTNSLLVNGLALVPRYSKKTFRWGSEAYTDAVLLDEYNKAVEEAYISAGFQVQFVPADRLISENGAIHCATKEFHFNG